MFSSRLAHLPKCRLHSGTQWIANHGTGQDTTRSAAIGSRLISPRDLLRVWPLQQSRDLAREPAFLLLSCPWFHLLCRVSLHIGYIAPGTFHSHPWKTISRRKWEFTRRLVPHFERDSFFVLVFFFLLYTVVFCGCCVGMYTLATNQEKVSEVFSSWDLMYPRW